MAFTVGSDILTAEFGGAFLQGEVGESLAVGLPGAVEAFVAAVGSVEDSAPAPIESIVVDIASGDIVDIVPNATDGVSANVTVETNLSDGVAAPTDATLMDVTVDVEVGDVAPFLFSSSLSATVDVLIGLGDVVVGPSDSIDLEVLRNIDIGVGDLHVDVTMMDVEPLLSTGSLYVDGLISGLPWVATSTVLADHPMYSGELYVQEMAVSPPYSAWTFGELFI